MPRGFWSTVRLIQRILPETSGSRSEYVPKSARPGTGIQERLEQWASSGQPGPNNERW